MILSSGLRLQSLLQHEITTILHQELDNDAAIHLYSTGTHWVAFEHSAYQLIRQYPESDLTPFFFDNYPFPVLMASIQAKDLKETSIIMQSERRLLFFPPMTAPSYRQGSSDRESRDAG